jgi:phosphate transport system substrate-binding protein
VRSFKVVTPRWALLLAVFACSPPDDPIRVDGSPGVLPLVAALATAYGETHGGARPILASGLGASARAAAVADGTIDIAMASHGVDADELRRLGLTAHEIARTAVVFAVNAGVPVRGLTRSQVCDILSGRAANWNRFRGNDIAIVPLMRPSDEVDAEVAVSGVACLRDLPLGGNVRIVERPDSMAAALSATAGAFGVTSMTMVEASAGRMAALALDGVQPVGANVASGAYAMTRRSILLTRASPPPRVARLLDFVRGAQGQRVIRASGAVPVAR